MNIIDEKVAEQANNANSFYDYKRGSATAEYNKAVEEATQLAEAKKRAVSPYYHDKIDGLLEAYCRRLAAWTNASNRNRASCPSILISGGGNFPTRKKQQQNAREDKLWAEYKEIKGLLDKIRSVGSGAVDLADPHAREILEDQLAKQKEFQAGAKRVNAWFRKHGTCVGCPGFTQEETERMQAAFERAHEGYSLHDVPFPSYSLTSIREKVKRLEKRIEQLDALQNNDSEDITFEGGRIVQNGEANRLQILFDEKPDDDLRQRMKLNGFRWSPRAGAWQRQLTDNAIHAAKSILGI